MDEWGVIISVERIKEKKIIYMPCQCKMRSVLVLQEMHKIVCPFVFDVVFVYNIFVRTVHSHHINHSQDILQLASVAPRIQLRIRQLLQ